MRDTIDMARETKMPYDFVTGEPINLEKLKAFEALVRADERAANIACIGRIAAMVVDPIDQARLYQAMDSIRARSEP